MKRLHQLIVIERHVSAVVAGHPGLAGEGPGERAAGPRPAGPAGGRDDPRPGAAGGRLLSAKVGGPSVFPPQPAGVTTEGTYGDSQWKPSEGEDRYRRGLYTFTKRTAPFAMFATFDAPSGEACVARREVSNTPLQALTLLNDVGLHRGRAGAGPELATGTAGRPRSSVDTLLPPLPRPPADRAMNCRAGAVLATPAAREFARKELDATRDRRPGEADVGRAGRAGRSWPGALFNLDEAVTKK